MGFLTRTNRTATSTIRRMIRRHSNTRLSTFSDAGRRLVEAYQGGVSLGNGANGKETSWEVLEALGAEAGHMIVYEGNHVADQTKGLFAFKCSGYVSCVDVEQVVNYLRDEKLRENKCIKVIDEN